MSRFFWAVAAVPLFASPAAAQDLDCKDPQTQSDMNLCAAADFETADAELNEAYAAARTAMRAADADQEAELKGAEEALRKAQRGWIDYRDGHCTDVGFAARGGTMEPLLVDSCKAELTRLRTRELKSLVEEQSQ